MSRDPQGGRNPKLQGGGGRNTSVFHIKQLSPTHIAYAHGEILGDVTLIKTRNQWRTTLSTTHPALEKAYIQTFIPLSTDNKIRKHPVLGAATPYKWILWTTIKPEVAKTLTIRGKQAIQFYVNNKQQLAALTAGLIDTDGTIALSIVRRKRLRYKPRFEPKVAIANSDKEMLETLGKAWAKYGIILRIRKNRKPQTKRPWKGKATVYELVTSAYQTIIEYLETILPYMKHWEKITKAKITIHHLRNNTPWNPHPIEEIRSKLEQVIKQQVQEYIKQAQQAYQNKKTYIIAPNKIIERKTKRLIRKEFF